MSRKNLQVEARYRALAPVARTGGLSLHGVRLMQTGVGGKVHRCTIAGHCRTRVFEFPRIDLDLNGDKLDHFIYDRAPTHACVTADLIGYFENGMTRSTHYALNPCLRHEINETAEEIISQKGGKTPAFVVIEEQNALAPLPMVNGECSIMDEVLVRGGETIPMLIGGRAGKRSIVAWPSSDGAWPETARDPRVVNLILAAVRVGQQTSGPIRKYIDQSCFVTDDGQFVVKGPTGSTPPMRLTTSVPMDADAFESRAEEIRQGITAMEPDVMGSVSTSAHMALLVKAMYSEEHKGDAEKLLEFLRLWQSLEETSTKLGHRKSVRQSDKIVSGKNTLRELTNYRNGIAHWWTETIDENYLSNLKRTINELIRRKYF